MTARAALLALAMSAALATAACDGRRAGDDALLPTELTPEERALFLPEGAPVAASPAPPAIQGGTLLVLADGQTALAADPDRDQLYVADIAQRVLLHTIGLEPGDEPGRAVQDAHGVVHVALRRAGAVVSLSPESGEIIERRPVCAAPSGIAYEPGLDRLHVACRGGALLSYGALGGPLLRELQLAPGLRDVVMAGQQLLVSRFRQSDVWVIDAEGSVTRRVVPATGTRGFQAFPMVPRVAWRLTSGPGGSTFMLHQRATDGPVGEKEGSYVPSLGCDGIVQTVVSMIDPSGAEQPPASLPLAATVATDVSLSPDGQRIAIAATGNAFDRGGMLAEVLVLPRARATEAIGCAPDAEPHFLDAEVTAIAFDAQSQWLAQSREPAALLFEDGTRLPLSHKSRRDTALALFHLDPGSGVACASCHPAGAEDGHLWRFIHTGPRRTQTLAGTLANTAPYHWNGNMDDLPHIFEDVFTGRMMAAPISQPQRDLFAGWLDALPAPVAPAAKDEEAVTRGEQLFRDPVVACASCHTGPRFTNNETVDVGSGGPFQVPSLLGLIDRAPYMHYGCAQTLRDRFGPCGGYQHGKTDHLTPAQLDDLIAYLETL